MPRTDKTLANREKTPAELKEQYKKYFEYLGDSKSGSEQTNFEKLSLFKTHRKVITTRSGVV